MKILIASLFLSVPAFADFNAEGEFVFPHKVGFMSYDKKGCLEDKGTWDGDDTDGICIFDGEDSITVSRKDNLFTANVNTITTNAHMCDFTGTGEFTSMNVLTVRADSQEYIPGEDGKDGKFVPAVCELKVMYGEDNTVNVTLASRYETCEQFCGMNAGLEIEKATRK